jgi:hypothetical protein
MGLPCAVVPATHQFASSIIASSLVVVFQLRMVISL